MKVLVACEFSGVVRDAFTARGHDAWSCDLLPSDKTGNHIQEDVMNHLDENWDMMIAHPPCTYLANSGVCHLYNKDKSINKERWQKMKEAARFFHELYFADVTHHIKKICIENPVMHIHAKTEIGIAFCHDKYPEKQVIQPWMFGHPEKKATCLWLVNLPPLKETNNVFNEMQKLPKNQQQRIHYMTPSPNRQKLRSITFQGIAQAMAEQWG